MALSPHHQPQYSLIPDPPSPFLTFPASGLSSRIPSRSVFLDTIQGCCRGYLPGVSSRIPSIVVVQDTFQGCRPGYLSVMSSRIPSRGVVQDIFQGRCPGYLPRVSSRLSLKAGFQGYHVAMFIEGCGPGMTSTDVMLGLYCLVMSSHGIVHLCHPESRSSPPRILSRRPASPPPYLSSRFNDITERQFFLLYTPYHTVIQQGIYQSPSIVFGDIVIRV